MEQKELTFEIVKNFVSYMCIKHGLKIRDKRDSRFMKIVGWFMEKFGKISQKDFINKVVTNLFKRLWLFFKVGDESECPFMLQIRIIGHECQHDFQRNFLYPFRYVFSRKWRAIYEREAMATSMEITYWFTGKLLNPTHLAMKLEMYGCDAEDIYQTKLYLNNRRRRIYQGIIDTKAGKQSIQWFEVYIPSLKKSLEAKYGVFS
jgi:hypothetical protein